MVVVVIDALGEVVGRGWLLGAGWIKERGG
jgi:hypothetical protein